MSKRMMARLAIAYRSWIYRVFGIAAHHPHRTWIAASDALWAAGVARRIRNDAQARASAAELTQSVSAAARRAQQIGIADAATDRKVARHLRHAQRAAFVLAMATQTDPPARRHRLRNGLLVGGALTAAGAAVWWRTRPSGDAGAAAHPGELWVAPVDV